MTFGLPVHRFCLGSALLPLLASGLFMTTVVPAHADLRICNQTANIVSVALGYRAERGWMSEGWWQAPPGDCRVLYQGDLQRRFYYLFAVDDIGGGSWDGQVFMCTRDETFTIFGVEDCLARGYERTGFFEIDTQSRTDWTLQLTENAGAPSIVGPDVDEDLEEPAFLIDAEGTDQSPPLPPPPPDR